MGTSFYKGEQSTYQTKLPPQFSGKSSEIFVGQVLAISYDDATLGRIVVKILDVDRKSDEAITRTAIPASLNLIKYPLPGELVFLFNAAGVNTIKNMLGIQLYYITTITAANSITFNSNPFFTTRETKKSIEEATDNGYEVRFENKIKNLGTYKKPWPSNEVIEKPALKPYEGDLILQGRTGTGIRFSSTVLQADGNPWSAKGGVAGDAITVISVSKTRSDVDRVEDVNKDDASIYMCQSQTVPVVLSTSRELRSLKYTYDVKDGATTILTDYTTYLDTPQEEIQYQDLVGATGTDLTKIPTPPQEATPEQLQTLIDSIKDEDLEYLIPTADQKPKNRRGAELQLVRIDGQFLEKTAAKALLLMKQAAKQAGHSLHLTSGYRPSFGPNFKVKSSKGKTYTLTTQEILRRQKNRWVNRGDLPVTDEEFVFNAPPQYFNPLTAKPGASVHSDGTAADFNTGSRTTPTFGPLRTEMYKWLINNSHKYGFVRCVPTEEWHFEYRPQSALNGPYGGFPKLISNQGGRNGLQFYSDLGLDRLSA